MILIVNHRRSNRAKKNYLYGVGQWSWERLPVVSNEHSRSWEKLPVVSTEQLVRIDKESVDSKVLVNVDKPNSEIEPLIAVTRDNFQHEN